MQTYKYDSFVDCVKQTYKTEHLRGFFRGMFSFYTNQTQADSRAPGVTAPIASVTIVRTVSFSIYQRSKYAYAPWFKRNFGVDPLIHANSPGAMPNLSTISCFGAAGATAGSFITVIACAWFDEKYYELLLTDSRPF